MGSHIVPFRTDPIPFDDFALQYGYNDLDDNIEQDKTLKSNLREHYLNVNVRSAANQDNVNFGELKSTLKSYINQYDLNLSSTRTPQVGALGVVDPTAAVKFDPNAPGFTDDLADYANALSLGFSTGLSSAASGVGLIGNTVSRLFEDDSDFGLGLAQYGEDLTNRFRSTFEIQGDQSFGTDVAQGVGQFVSMFVGGLGAGGVARVGGRLLVKKQLKDKAGRIAATIGTATGVLPLAVGPQVTDMIDRYVDSLSEGEQFDQETVNELVLAGVLIGGVDSITPGKLFSNLGLLKKVVDKSQLRRRGFIGTATRTAGVEGATEFAQAIMADIVAEASINDSGFLDSLEVAIDNISESGREGTVGAGTGFVVGLLSVLLPGRAGPSTVDRDPQPTPDPTVTPPSPSPSPSPSSDTTVEGEGEGITEVQREGSTFDFQGVTYRVLEDTLNTDGTQGEVRAEGIREDGTTQVFTVDPTLPQSKEFIDDYLSKRRQVPFTESDFQRTTDQVLFVPSTGQSASVTPPEIFSYEASPTSPDQSVVPPVSQTAQTPVTTTATDGDSDSARAQLKARVDNLTLNEEGLEATGRFQRVRSILSRRNLASGGTLSQEKTKLDVFSEQRSGRIGKTRVIKDPIREYFLKNTTVTTQRAAELYDAGLRLSDVEIRQPIFDFQTALINEYGTINAEQKEVLHQAMKGNQQAIASLPPETAKAYFAMRDDINSKSIQLVSEFDGIISILEANLSIQQERLNDPNHGDVVSLAEKLTLIKFQRESIVANLPNADNPMGTYLHKSYGIFLDDANRADAFDKSGDRYRNFLRELTTAHIGLNGNLTNQQAQDQAQSDIDQLQKTIEDFKDSPNLTLDRPILNSIDALKERQAIPPYLAEFLDEIKDPAVNFAATIHQQRLLLTSIELAHNVRNRGEQQGWLSTQPDSTIGALTAFKGNNNNPGLMMLEGLYAPDYIVSGLNDYFQIPNVNGLQKVVNSTLAAVKIGKTVGSVGTQVRNLASAAWVLGINGVLFNAKGTIVAAGVIKEQLNGTGATDYHKMLVRVGVVSDGVALGTIRQLSNDVGVLDSAGLFSDSPQTTEQLLEGPGIFKTLTKGAIKAYQASDDYPKIIGFESNRDLLANAYGLSRDDPRVIEQAAVRVRDTYFTYSKVNRLIKALRSIPGAPPFISFPAEVYRTSKNWFKWIGIDLRSGNPVLTRNAGLRLVSASATLGVSYNIGEILGSLVFGDDQEEETEKALVTELMANGKYTDGNDIHITRVLEDGRYEAVNMSRYNPYAGPADVIKNFIEGDADFDDKLLTAVKGFASPFYQPDVTVSAVNDAIDAYDRAVGNDFDKGLVFLKSLSKNVLPTSVTEALNVFNAYNGDLLHVDESKVTVERQLARFLGASTDVVNPLIIVAFRGRALTDAIKLGDNAFRTSVTGRNKPNLDPGAFNRQLGEIEVQYGRMLKDVNILKQLGYDMRVGGEVYISLTRGKKGTGGPLSAELAKLLLTNQPFKGLKQPTRAQENLVRRTRFYQGDAAALEAQILTDEKRRKLSNR